MERVCGYITRVIYYRESNNFTVIELESEQELITVVGNFPEFKEGEYLCIEGQWTEHHTFGRQLKGNNFELASPDTIDGLERYLNSGVIKGIGEKKSKMLIEHFEKDVLDIIRFSPERLTEVSGIGPKTAKSISDSFNENREVMDVIVQLGEYGIPSNYAMRMYKVYKGSTVPVIMENPYKVIPEVPGMGFKAADAIAARLGMEINSPFRIQAGIMYVLNLCYKKGHMFLPERDLISAAMKVMSVSDDLVEDSIRELVLQGEIKLDVIDSERVYYLINLYQAEVNVANGLVSLCDYEYKNDNIDVNGIISRFQMENRIQLDSIQVEAIKAVVKNGLVIITGGPGTGKTTILNCILEAFKKLNYKVALAAPTGRAAKKMSESTGGDATTIHRLLEYGFSTDDDFVSFDRNEDNPLDYDAVIIDEASMIDIFLMDSLLKAIKKGTRIVFTGDIDQLPSVGPGNVLKDMIDSKLINVVRLNKVYRQARESNIVVNAHKIKNGEMPILNDKDGDFFFIECQSGEKIQRNIVELCSRRLKQFDFMDDIQVISPIKKGQIGVHELNKALQNCMNPHSQSKAEKTFGSNVYREGDKVMQIRNNYQKEWTEIEGGQSGKGIFNGDIGVVERINTVDKKIRVVFDSERRVVYDYEDINQLMHAYAITVHKSQGSEFPVVIMPVFRGPSILLNRNLFYTAVTRAKKMVVLVGGNQYIHSMVKNVNSMKRNTALSYRIENSIFKG